MVEKLKLWLFMSRDSSRGQALLVVVLVLVITLTVGLSVASRSITSLRTTSEGDTSQRAFSAAEAGIEQAVKTKASGSLSGLLSTVTFTVNPQSGSVVLLNNGNSVNADDGIDVWLLCHNNAGAIDYIPDDPANLLNCNNLSWIDAANSGSTQLKVYWGSTSGQACPSSPAIEVQVVTGLNGQYFQQDRYVYDACARGNNFTFVSPGSFSQGGKTYLYQSPLIAVSNSANYKPIYVRVTPLYQGTQVAVTSGSGGKQFPNQGNIYQSTGSLGGTSRKVTYFKQTVCPPEFCQYSLFQSP